MNQNLNQVRNLVFYGSQNLQIPTISMATSNMQDAQNLSFTCIGWLRAKFDSNKSWAQFDHM